MAFKSGEIIFYPAHGVAKVAGIEVRQFGDFTEEFFILELNRGGRSLVPTKNVEQAGLRALVTQKRARELLKGMRDEPTIDKTKSWKDRASKYAEGLKTGTPLSYAKILQELMYRARADKLSTTETKMLETARSYFVAEIGHVLDMSPERVEKELAEAIATLLPDLPVPSEGEEGEEGIEGDEDAGDEAAEAPADEGEDGEEKPKAKAAKKTAKKAAKKTASKPSKKR